MVKAKKKQGLSSKKKKQQNCQGSDSPKKHGKVSSSRRFGSIRDQLDAHGLYIKQIPADGNCFFRSVFDQISGQVDSIEQHRSIRDHESMRREIVKYIKDKKDYFSCFVEDDEAFDDYIERMAKPEEWAGQIEIQAVSMYFAVNITIYQDFQPPWNVINFAESDAFIHLSYHDASHYNSVCDLKTRRPASGTHCEKGATFFQIDSLPKDSKKSRERVESEKARKNTDKAKEEKIHVEQGTKVVKVQIRHVYLDDVQAPYLSVTFKFIKSRKKKESKHVSGGRDVGPNKKCPCGSNKKHKKCCKNKTLMNREADETETVRQNVEHICI